MNLKPQTDGTNKVVVQAADRSAMEKTLCVLRIIAANEKETLAADLAAAIKQDLNSLLCFYPDTRKGKKDDPQKPLTGMEEGDAAEGKKKS